ncbi:MAG: hypothetical protein WC449_06080 [Candidatus Paceibacterota bacterium]
MITDWRSFKMPFGKYKGDTMYIIYINDFSYIAWLDGKSLDSDLRNAVDGAIEHKNRTDPQ